MILTARSIDKLQQVCLELEKMGAEKKWSNPHPPEYRYLDLAELNGDEGSGQVSQMTAIMPIQLNTILLHSCLACSGTRRDP